MTTYDKDSIKILSDIEHIRKRASMYIGDLSNPAQLFFEILDNAQDEWAITGCDITIKINTKENSYFIQDTSRGIPIGTKKDKNGNEREILDILVTSTQSGGKFDNNAYLMSAGLHGIGSTATNALSQYFQIQTTRGNESRCFAYVKGKQSLPVVKFEKIEHGTQVYFKPDASIFISVVIPLNIIEQRCKIANAFGINTKLYIDDILVNVDTKMEDLYPKEDVNTYYQYPEIYSSHDTQKERMMVYLKYTSDTRDKYQGYTNLIYNSAGGSHISFISKLICEAWEEYIKISKIKLETELSKSDYLVGLRCICACFISNPEFASQTKERLSVSRDTFKPLEEVLKSQIINALKFSDKQSRALIKRFEEYRISQNKLLSRKQISSLIKTNEDNPNNIRRRSIVENLVECISTKRDHTELYLVEGRSAAGAGIRTRNKMTQAILPLRGKILNVSKLSATQALKSEEICNITNSIGCGIHHQCDSRKSRYEKVIIACDSDPDGRHITNLIMGVFINLLADIVKDGRLYIVRAPFYGWKDKSGRHYTNNVKDIPKGIRYIRYKGLGEMSDIEYQETLMSTSQRNLYQVEYPNNIEEFNKVLGTSNGKADIIKELGLVRYEGSLIEEDVND